MFFAFEEVVHKPFSSQCLFNCTMEGGGLAQQSVEEKSDSCF